MVGFRLAQLATSQAPRLGVVQVLSAQSFSLLIRRKASARKRNPSWLGVACLKACPDASAREPTAGCTWKQTRTNGQRPTTALSQRPKAPPWRR